MKNVNIVNKTPHIVRVAKENGEIIEFPPDATPARVRQESKWVGEVLWIPIVKAEYGEIDGLPEPEDGTYYIVSTIVKEAALAAGRSVEDLLVPDSGPTAIRKDGQIYAVRHFIVH